MTRNVATGATAVGPACTAQGVDSSAFGFGAFAVSGFSRQTVIGRGATGQNNDITLVGAQTGTATGDSATGVGSGITLTGTQSVVVGAAATATNAGSTAMSSQQSAN